MCGRYTLTVDQEALEAALQVPLLLEHAPRFNIAPTQVAPVVVRESEGSAGSVVARSLRWGLIPHWADEAGIGARLINARAETVDRKPAFRDAFRRGRCLVPADGFYEWRKADGGKQPYWIHGGDGEIFTFAGISDGWRSPEGEVVRTFSILTTDAPPELAGIHPRVPVMVGVGDRDRWLDPAAGRNELEDLLAAPEGTPLRVRAVTRRVNSPAHDDGGCLEALNPEAGESEPLR